MNTENLDSSTVSFDAARALDAVEGDWELMTELTEIFLEDLPQQLKDLELAIHAKDCSQIFKALHKLKGATGPFFSISTSDLLHEGLSLAESKNLKRVQLKVGEIQTAIDSLRLQLRAVSWPDEARG